MGITAAHVASIENMRNSYIIFTEKSKEGSHFENLGINTKITLNRVGGCGLHQFGPGFGSCEHDKVSLSYIRGERENFERS